MKPEWHIVKRVLWPERASLFVIVGGAAGMAGDLTSFFADMVSPMMLSCLFATVAAASALLCLQRAAMVDAGNAQAVEEVVNCGVCDALRFGVFATACFMLLMIVGQGKSATETIAEKLGLIQQDVATIRQDVAQIADVTQSHALVENPANALEFFTNAWIYTNMRRDSANAYATMQKLYTKYSPNKIDAAELYFTIGRQIKDRRGLLGEIEQLGTERKDATLLVIAARHAETYEEADALYARARAIDPEQPFAYWDMQRTATNRALLKGTPEESGTAAEKEIANLEAFLKRYNAHPASQFFFMPQYQGDYDQIGRQMMTTYRQTKESYDRLRNIKSSMPQRKP